MLFAKKPLKIVDIDLTPDGVILSFSNGVSALYHNHFLFEARLHDGNVPLTDQDDGGRPRPTRKK